MDAKLELLPQVLLDRIDMKYEEKQGEAAAYAKKFKERHGLSDEQAAKRLLDDQKFHMLRRRDRENSAYLAQTGRQWEALRDLGAWTLEQVATYPERYDKWPSFRDASNGKPRRVTRDDVREVLFHLVDLGLLDTFESKPTRGPSTTRYRITDDGREVLTMLEVEE